MQNIVFLKGHGATNYYRSGWAKALGAAGSNMIFWDKERVSAHDMFHDCRPDTIVIGTWELDQHVLKCIKAYNTKVILWGPNWGEYDSEIDYNTHPIQRAEESEIENVKRLMEFNDVGYIFTYYTQDWIERTHSFWKDKLGLQPIGFPLGADVFDYPLGQPQPEFKCDVAFVGGYWPYKAANMLPFFAELFYNEHLNTKIFGYGNWPFIGHLGFIDTKDVSNLFASATCCINLFEPFAVEYEFDINERFFKIMSAGGMCLSQHSPGAEKFFPANTIDWFQTPDELVEKVQHYRDNPEKTRVIADCGTYNIYNQHTYLHRARDMYRLFNCEDKVKRLDNFIKSVQDGVCKIKGWSPDVVNTFQQL